MSDSPGVSDGMSVPVSRFDLGQVSVNRMGYGAMRLSGPGVFGPPRDHVEAVAVLRAASRTAWITSTPLSTTARMSSTT